jgi:2'-5' RNA ligase
VEYSHFLSIPVGYDENIRDSYAKVMGRISQITKIPQEKLTRPSMLHLTVLMLPLYEDKEKIGKVKEVLKELEKEIIDSHSDKIYLKFKGIGTFAENPAQAKNIYFSIV